MDTLREAWRALYSTVRPKCCVQCPITEVRPKKIRDQGSGNLHTGDRQRRRKIT
jgi:hypothetical protein